MAFSILKIKPVLDREIKDLSMSQDDFFYLRKKTNRPGYA